MNITIHQNWLAFASTETELHILVTATRNGGYRRVQVVWYKSLTASTRNIITFFKTSGSIAPGANIISYQDSIWSPFILYESGQRKSSFCNLFFKW